MRARRTHRLAAALTGLLLVGVAACGDDEDDTADATAPTTTTAESPSTTAESPSTTATPDEPVAVEVTAVDFAFEGVPATVAAGTTLTLQNDSTVEVHELIAVLAPDGAPSLEALLADPGAVGALLGGAPPATVVVAVPGGAVPGAVVGDGTLTEPGRYILICAIPTGADPDEYLAAAAAAQGGPPDVEGGPPHFVQGMLAEIQVE